MKYHNNKTILGTLVVLLLVTLACGLPQSSVSTPTNLPVTPPSDNTSVASIPTNNPAPSPSHTPRATLPASATSHRIATHRIYGIAGFYDTQTNESFIPRGANYFILVPVSDHVENRLFAVGVYDHDRTQADFSTLSQAGYNTLRIILDGCTSGEGCIGLENGQGLNPAYLDNIVDLMKLAREAQLFLILSSAGLPDLGGYAASASQGADQNFAYGRNASYLTSSGIQAAQQYWADLLLGLITRDAPFDIVLGWELQAEQYYLSDAAPFSLEDGKVTPANGKTYDLSDPAQKQALAVDSLRFYIDQVKGTILNYDPTALVTMGFFAPDEPNPWRDQDNRYVETADILEESSLDFYDFHAYPGDGLSIEETAENFGMGGRVAKPVLMGEVGAYTWNYPEIPSGAIAIQDWIASSCEQGFSGWIYYGYYPVPAGLLGATWGLVDEQGTLLKAISPKFQPDACLTTVLPGRNLALGKQVSVSASLPEQPPQMAVDGDFNTQWSAGAFPTQWIEIDLEALSTIGEIRLTVGQWPAGDVLHQLWVGSSQENMQLVYEFSGHEYDYDVLNFVPAVPLNGIRFVRIVTTESPSWVSWREIEVLAPFMATPTAAAENTPAPVITPTP
jgi:hypothetical protein